MTHPALISGRCSVFHTSLICPQTRLLLIEIALRCTRSRFYAQNAIRGILKGCMCGNEVSIVERLLKIFFCMRKIPLGSFLLCKTFPHRKTASWILLIGWNEILFRARSVHCDSIQPSHSYEGEGCRMEDGAEEMCPFRSLSGKSQANAISGKDFLEQFLEREQGQKICGSSECMGFSLHWARLCQVPTRATQLFFEVAWVKWKNFLGNSFLKYDKGNGIWARNFFGRSVLRIGFSRTGFFENPCTVRSRGRCQGNISSVKKIFGGTEFVEWN